MAKSSAEERQAKIMELLADNGTMRAIDIAGYFHVSRETIRRDLNALSESGSIKKVFGSATPIQDFNISPINSRIIDNAYAKQSICEKALEFVTPKSVLFLDTGSTTLCMAKLLKTQSNLTIITNSIPVVNELIDSDNELVLTGGSVNPKIQCTTGMQSDDFLEKIKTDIAILGSSGFYHHKGPTSNHFDDLQIKKLAARNAATSIVLADSSKASVSALMQYAEWKDIDYLITDDAMPDEMFHELKSITNVIKVPIETTGGKQDD